MCVWYCLAVAVVATLLNTQEIVEAGVIRENAEPPITAATMEQINPKTSASNLPGDQAKTTTNNGFSVTENQESFLKDGISVHKNDPPPIFEDDPAKKIQKKEPLKFSESGANSDSSITKEQDDATGDPVSENLSNQSPVPAEPTTGPSETKKQKTMVRSTPEDGNDQSLADIITPVQTSLPDIGLSSPAVKLKQILDSNKNHDSTITENKERPSEATDPEDLNERLLTKMITPVQSSSQKIGPNEFSAAPVTPPTTIKNNLSPIKEEQVISEINNNAPPTTKSNAYTITANEFAEKTAMVHEQQSKPDEPEASDGAVFSESTQKIDGPTATVQGADEKAGTKIELGQDKSASDKSEKSTTIQSTDSATKIVGSKNKFVESEQSDVKKPLDIISSDKENAPDSKVTSSIQSVEPSKPSNAEITNDGDLTELANRISSELKVYSNEVVLAWDKNKDKVSWTAEAANVLKEYMDRITISQDANRKECVEQDLENYDKRKKILHNVMKLCESELKREEWNELEEKTKEILNKIKGIVKDAEDSINKLSKNEADFQGSRTLIENDAKTKLNALNIVSVKETFSKLKDDSLRADEENYEKCLSSRPEQSMITDTRLNMNRLKDLMDDYSLCFKRV